MPRQAPALVTANAVSPERNLLFKDLISMEPSSPSEQLTSSSDATPLLPPEIEYEIFVLAFRNTKDYTGQITLLLVAKRVHEWLISLFYNLIDLVHTNPQPPISVLEKYGHHARHLIAKYMRDEDLPAMLHPCPNITNLALWYGTDPMPCILDLPVQRLTLDSWGFLYEEFKNNPTDPRLVKWCSKITHLALGLTLTLSTTPYLTLFPRLEYLLILDFYSHDFGFGTLKRCSNLKLTIRLLGPVTADAKTLVVQDKPPSDQDNIPVVRIDGLYEADWKRGVNGFGDMWDLAEREVERRKGNGREIFEEL